MTSIEFAQLARRLGEALRAAGLEVPAFRSPPRSPSLMRSLARHPDGTCTVSVRLRHRSRLAVAVDMVEGSVATNRLEGLDAARARDALWPTVEAIMTASAVGSSLAA